MDILAADLGFTEGPVNCQDGSFVVTSIDRGKLYRVRDSGKVELAATTGGGANGATEGRGGILYVTQNGGAAPAINEIRSAPGVQIVYPNGRVRLFGEGMRSPNDLCFGPDGFLYVTDPTRKPERDDGRIWRCNVETLECTLLMTCDWYPNGIGFSTEDDVAYVADSRHSRIMRIPLDDFAAEAAETVFTLDHGKPDGFAFDMDGNLVIGCPNLDGPPGDVQVYRSGKLVEIVRPGNAKLYTNVSISADRRIFVCEADTGRVLVDKWPSAGLPLHPFRGA